MKIAVVTPWFGEGLTGGAERLAWEIAFGLRDRCEGVTVFTTCARSFADPWNENVHSPGETLVDGVRLSRFLVDRSNPRRFQEINRKLLAFPRSRLKPGISILNDIELRDFVGHNINSTPLLTHLARRGDEYDAIIFLPYLYGLTLRGWRVVRERAVIAPCLHDEVYAYLPPVAEMMRGCAGLLFNSNGSYALARSLYGPGIEPRSAIVGSGITWPTAPTLEDPKPIRGFVPEDRRYVLHLGRRSPEKNTGLLVDAFNRYREIEPESDLALVFAGAGDAVQSPHAVVLGEVSEVQKSRLLRGALALAQPSVNESFSRVMMEAWAVGRPVAINGNCPSTAGPLRETGAGWAPVDVVDWIAVFSAIDSASPGELAALGGRAQEYVATTANWENVLDRLASALTTAVATNQPRAQPIVHVLDRAVYADSATLLALQYSDLLARNGFASSVIAGDVDDRLGSQVRRIEDADKEGAVVLAYDNSQQLKADARLTFGEGSLELTRSGKSVASIPLWADLGAWNVEPNAEVMAPLVDGRTNILALGAICAQNHVLEIVEAFAFYFALDFDARLLLVGATEDADYLTRVRDAIERTGLEHRVTVCGEVSRPALAAMYRTAHLFVSWREHYETGLALLEAIAHDIPVCALASPGAQRILGTSGILVRELSRARELAALWRVLVNDPVTRARVIHSQRCRPSATPESVLAALRKALPRAHEA